MGLKPRTLHHLLIVRNLVDSECFSRVEKAIQGPPPPYQYSFNESSGPDHDAKLVRN